MTDRDLMQQALDALGGAAEYTALLDDFTMEAVTTAITDLNERLAHCDRCGKKLGGEGDIHTCTPKKINQCGETCERAKMCATCAGVLTEFDEAVAAVDATLHHAVDHWQDRALKAEALLAQPEPVAEVKAKMTGGNVGISTVIHEIYSPYREPLQPGDKLYTAPPQRKPLTDEQIDDLSRTMVKGSKSANWICRAIEAAHGIKEKNNDN